MTYVFRVQINFDKPTSNYHYILHVDISRITRCTQFVKMGLMGFRLLLAMLTTAAVADAYQPKGKGYSILRVHPKGSLPVHPKGDIVAINNTRHLEKPLLPQLPLHLNPKGSFLHGHRRLTPVNPTGAILPSRPYSPRYNLRGSYPPVRPKGQLEPNTPLGLHQPLYPNGPRALPTQHLHPKSTPAQPLQDTRDMSILKQTSSTQMKTAYSTENKNKTWNKKKETNIVYPNYPSDPSANKSTVSPWDQKKQTHPSNQHNPLVNSQNIPTAPNQQTNPSEPAGQVKDLNSQDQRQSRYVQRVNLNNHGQQGNRIVPRLAVGQNPNYQDQGVPPSRPGGWQLTNPSTYDQFPSDTWQVVEPSPQGQNPSDPWLSSPKHAIQ
ncbi:sporozoite surface protein 2-like [Haliotis rufescens]|uniref:sporozoite surface protein 2-like n=1 Tax=Haliotis rufescens TaxID=6454 RepID=UPI00201F55DF|nr:sporozoite surface protein 2-like [Haliotis rufescens]